MRNLSCGSYPGAKFSAILLLILLLASAPLLMAQTPAPPYFSFSNYQLVSSTRINPYVWEYGFTAEIANLTTQTAYGVTATVHSPVATAVVTASTLSWDSVPANARLSSTGVFKIRIDRRYPLDYSSLSWTTTQTFCPAVACQRLEGWTAKGCSYTDLRTAIFIRPRLARWVWEPTPAQQGDATGGAWLYDLRSCPVDSGQNPNQCWCSWSDEYTQASEPPGKDNFCGPTAGMNMLGWYGEVGDYYQLAGEMRTNNWMNTADELEGVALCAAVGEPTMIAACIAGYNSLLNAGTLPQDMEKTLRKHSPPNYWLYRTFTANPGVERFEQLLRGGNPIVVLLYVPVDNLWYTDRALHWAVVKKITRYPGAIYVDFANSSSVTWDEFVDQWSFKDMNGIYRTIADAKGLAAYTWMYYEQTTELRDGYTLTRGQSVTSYDGRFMLILQADGNLVLYGLGQALWASDTHGSDVTHAVMQGDGNLVLYNDSQTPRWSTHTCCDPPHPGAFLAVQNDGNLVLYDANNSKLWASNTGGH